MLQACFQLLNFIDNSFLFLEVFKLLLAPRGPDCQNCDEEETVISPLYYS